MKNLAANQTNYNKLIVLLGPVIFLVACSNNSKLKSAEDQMTNCPKVNAGNATWYPFEPNRITKDGILVDDINIEADLDLLDSITQKLEKCVQVHSNQPEFFIEKGCIKVKIATGWFDSPCDNSKQVFQCSLPETWCSDKSRVCQKTWYFNPKKCYCHGTVQDGEVLVVTPNLAAYKEELIHWRFNLPDPLKKTLPEEIRECL